MYISTPKVHKVFGKNNKINNNANKIKSKVRNFAQLAAFGNKLASQPLPLPIHCLLILLEKDLAVDAATRRELVRESQRNALQLCNVQRMRVSNRAVARF